MQINPSIADFFRRKALFVVAGLVLLIVFVATALNSNGLGFGRSPENLPFHKNRFNTQIAAFEAQKERADNKVEDGVKMLSGMEKAIADARDVDKEFNRVYTRWEQVDRQVNRLDQEYRDLRKYANELFAAMEDQTNSLNDVATQTKLMNAIRSTRADYAQTLQKTELAINQLYSLRDDALDIVKALEVAVALGQVAQINDGLNSIEHRVSEIMQELNATISESKQLYEQKIGTFGSSVVGR